MHRGWFTGPLLPLLLLAAPAFAQAGGSTHTVVAGETLSGIAGHYGITIEQLLDHNADLQPDRIRVGQEIVLGGERRFVDYRVRTGDTLSGIAKRHGVQMEELSRWNPGLRPDHIRIGQTLRIYGDKIGSPSISAGSPSDGELKQARRLPHHPAYVIRDRERAWATDETVRGILSAFDHVKEHHPNSAKLRVHDLSLEDGGPMDDHRSHQSGRDADISYYQLKCEGGVCPFRALSPGTLDVRRTWTLLSYWLERDMLEAVFIDYRLQAALYRHARAEGATGEQLARWFQYPGGRTSTTGVIRHFPKHADHMHVRFACHPSDPDCKTFRPLLMQGHAKR